MIEKILATIATYFLKWLWERAEAALIAHAQQVEEDRAKGKVNEENIKRYEQAATEADRLKAALALLNRTTPAP